MASLSNISKRRKERILRKSPINFGHPIRPINNLNMIANLGPQNVTTQFELQLFQGSVF